MPFSVAAKNTMLDALAVTHVSLHTADPGDTGANEVAGGAPAYARKAITIDAAAAGNRNSSTVPEFDVPAATTVTHVGFWTAAVAGVFLGGFDATDEVFAAQGTYRLDDADLHLNA